MLRRFAALLLLALLGGCAKPDLPEVVVQSASVAELRNFRLDLGERFSNEQLQTFDTALQELRLDAMNRGVATVEAREAAMRAAVNGKTVHQVEILGWQARQARFENEIAVMNQFLEHTLATAKGNNPNVQSNQDVLDRLHRQLAETKQRLAEWAVGKK